MPPAKSKEGKKAAVPKPASISADSSSTSKDGGVKKKPRGTSKQPEKTTNATCSGKSKDKKTSKSDVKKNGPVLPCLPDVPVEKAKIESKSSGTKNKKEQHRTKGVVSPGKNIGRANIKPKKDTKVDFRESENGKVRSSSSSPSSKHRADTSLLGNHSPTRTPKAPGKKGIHLAKDALSSGKNIGGLDIKLKKDTKFDFRGYEDGDVQSTSSSLSLKHRADSSLLANHSLPYTPKASGKKRIQKKTAESREGPNQVELLSASKHPTSTVQDYPDEFDLWSTRSYIPSLSSRSHIPSLSSSKSMGRSSKLRELAKSLTVPRKMKESGAESVNRIRKTIELNLGTDPFKWELLGTGSYYENSKLYEGGDFDCTFVATVPHCTPVFSLPGDVGPMFCALKMRNHERIPDHLKCIDNEGVWLSPKAFRRQFSAEVMDIVDGMRTMRRRTKIQNVSWELCPAVQLQISDYKGPTSEKNLQYDMDLVPAVKLHWPEPAREWKVKWLPKEEQDKIREQGAYCTAKIHPSEMKTAENKCKLWQLSFSKAEKTIFLHADGVLHSTGNTCRKKVLKVMKYIKQKAKESHAEIRSIMSLHLKAVLLQECDRHPRVDMWNDEHFELRLRDVITKFLEKLRSKELAHPFVKGVNMFSNMSNRESEMLCRHYTRFLEEYLGN